MSQEFTMPKICYCGNPLEPHEYAKCKTARRKKR